MAVAKKKILVVGTGSIGERHTRCILATNRAEVSICEINDNLRKKIADNYNIKNSTAWLPTARIKFWQELKSKTPSTS